MLDASTYPRNDRNVILACHLNFSAYGFWLPNDERGSNSHFVRAPHLRRFGLAPYERPKHSVAGKPHNTRRRQEAKRALHFRPVVFTGRQALSIANGFKEYIARSGLVAYACAILPKHVHLVTAAHRVDARLLVGQLKAAATRRLIDDSLHPFRGVRDVDGRLPSPWARGCTCIYLDTIAHVRATIGYVERNPVKEGKPVQRWSFVRLFEVG